jgi:hypothetical protein
MKILIIGGDWDDNGGKPSGYVKKFSTEIDKLCPGYISVYNGGMFKHLESMALDNYNVIFWFANVPNDKEKIIRQIKEINPKCILVSSKNNIDKKYSYMDLIARALQTKSNLLVSFGNHNGTIHATVLDPLCNCYATQENDIQTLVEILMDRISELKSFTRIGSKQVGGAIIAPDPEGGQFFEIINRCAGDFHELIHGANTSRFLGNASFRCENGFPSMRVDDKIFVSRRNIDKRDLTENGFVACNLNSDIVEYYGENKPSVDSPIQLALYRYYKNIKYMIHSHVYVKGAPFTSHKISCGAMEEVKEIISVWPQRDLYKFCINLKGHGSLIAGIDLSPHFDAQFIARPVPEI